ncbi:MAG TPA: hypothetical protein ACFCUC_07990 [Desulfobacterales bacterium]
MDCQALKKPLQNPYLFFTYDRYGIYETIRPKRSFHPFIYYELADERILVVLQTLSELAVDLIAARKIFQHGGKSTLFQKIP